MKVNGNLNIELKNKLIIEKYRTFENRKAKEPSKPKFKGKLNIDIKMK